MIMNGLPSNLFERFSDMVALIDKIEKWWILNVEIPIQGDFIDQKIKPEEVIPGRIVSIKMMLDVALGEDEQAESYIKEFKKRGILEDG